MKVYQFVDYCWTLKIILFLQLFFLSCLMPNWFFIFWSMVFKYYTALFTLVKVVFLYDALFFYANKGRFTTSKNFSKLWTFTAWFFGVILFGLGVALFVYTFIVYDPICGQYLAINIVMLCLASVQLAINVIKYNVKPEVTSSLVFFFVISIFNYGLVAATPYTTCVTSAN